MELRVLRYFLAVAREQSVSRAAAVLNLTQPTLSTQLRALEEELGCTLFVRGSRKITLTEEGMVLRKRAQEILDLVTKTGKELSAGSDVPAGEICIAAGEGGLMRLFARAAGALRSQNSAIRFNLSSGNSSYVLEMLDKGLADFGLLFDAVDTLKYETLPLPSRQRWGVLVKSSSPLARKEAVTAEDLRHLPLIVSRQETARHKLEKWFGASFDELDIAASYNLVLNAGFFSMEGIGYTLLFEGLIDTDINPGLAFRPLEPELCSEAVLVWKKYQVMSRVSQRFLTCLRQVFESVRRES